MNKFCNSKALEQINTAAESPDVPVSNPHGDYRQAHTISTNKELLLLGFDRLVADDAHTERQERRQSSFRVLYDPPSLTTNCTAACSPVRTIIGHFLEPDVMVDNPKMNPQLYLKWKDYPDRPNTWEPLGNLEGCHDILREFLITFTTNMNALTQANDQENNQAPFQQ
ncbi:MAG: hypothetical protein J3Q66DRAFT_367456 [Benniella sp.]|nr:MAG: hypothetical protein J3Q66DRAFT_367456 [Benniella sp.]